MSLFFKQCPFLSTSKFIIFAEQVVVKCHSLNGSCPISKPDSHRAHVLFTFNLGAAIPLRKQEGAAQGMQ